MLFQLTLEGSHTYDLMSVQSAQAQRVLPRVPLCSHYAVSLVGYNKKSVLFRFDYSIPDARFSLNL